MNQFLVLWFLIQARGDSVHDIVNYKLLAEVYAGCA